MLFGSGFCALVYQVVWLRLFRLVFGASHSATAAVLAIFMAGLGIGGLWLGRRADRHGAPLVLYGRLEIGISLAAAMSPLLVAGARAVYLGLGGTPVLGMGGGTVVRLLLSALVLAVPTLLMGGTLPAVVRAVERRQDAGRRAVGVLYAANTLGAVTGATWATFSALEVLGAQNTLVVAVVLNLLVAVAAIVLGRRLAAESEAPEPESEAAADTGEAGTDTDAGVASPPAGSAPAAPPVPTPLVLGAAAAVGFAFLLMEMVWYRMLAPILGGSTYTFGLILAVALLGIGGGGLLYGVGARSRRPTVLAFAVTCTLEALFVAVPLALGDDLALLAAWLRPMGETGFGSLVLVWAVLASAVVLPAALVSGYQFPLLVGLMGTGREGVGRQVGQTYAWNTAGAIAGSMAGGFGLLPVLGAIGAWRLVALLLCGMGLAALVVALRERVPRGRLLLVGGLTAATVLLSLSDGPTAVWRHTPIGAGRFKPSTGGTNALINQLRTRRRAVVWEADGVETSVALDGRYGYAFLLSGKSDGHVIGDAPTFIMNGLLGTLLHPDPARTLVIGLGTGETVGWMAQVDEVDVVDVVEMEPAIEEVARRCAPVSFDAMSNPKVKVHYGDGRELLLTTPERYDVIVSEPSNPYRAGIASLFTVEFYGAVQERLDDDGLFVQWVQAYDLSGSTVRTILATMGTVFPYVEVFESRTGSDTLVVASAQPIPHDPARVGGRLAQFPYREALAWTWGVDGLDGLYSGFVANDDFVDAVVEAEAGRVNTDDHSIIEFEFARNVGRGHRFSVTALQELVIQRGEHRPAVPEGAVDWRRATELRFVRAIAEQERPDLPAGLTGAPLHRFSARVAWARGDLGAAIGHWQRQEVPASASLDRLMLAESAAAVNHPDAERVIAGMTGRPEAEVAAVWSRLHLARGESAQASRALLAALAGYQASPWAFGPVMQRTLQLVIGQAARDPAFAEQAWPLLAEPFPVHVLEEYRHQARIELSRRMSDPARCVAAFGGMEPHTPWEESFLVQRLACYEAAGAPQQATARAELAAFRDNEPLPLGWGLTP